MAEKHPIEGIMYTALQGLKDMIDVNTIVGDAIATPDGSVIIPISKVAIGFAVGGSEFERYNAKNHRLTNRKVCSAAQRAAEYRFRPRDFWLSATAKSE